MNSEKLFEAIGSIDDKYLLLDKKPKNRKLGTAIICTVTAAAAALAITVLQPWSFFMAKSSAPAAPAPDVTEEEPGAPKHPLGYLTDTEISYEISPYAGLDELLMHLSENEQHNSGVASESETAGTDAQKDSSLSDVIAVNGYAYHPTDDGVMITKLDGQATESIGKIDLWANSMFFAYDKLAVTSGHYEYSEDGSETPYTTLSIYMNLFEDPSHPQLRDVYTVKGNYVDSFMHAGKLYLVTEDSECACGYSRSDEKSAYLPYIHHSGVISEYEEEITFKEDDLTVLASPTRINYTVVTVIDMKNGEISDTKAFYAYTERVFFSDGFIAFAVTQNAKQSVFVFDADFFEFMGRIEPFDSSDKSITHTEILHFAKKDSGFCLTGHITGGIGEEKIRTIFAAKANTANGAVTFDTFVPHEGFHLNITEITETDFGTLISFDEIQGDTVIGRMSIADYSYGAELINSASEFASVHGVDTAFYFGDPLGDITTLTDLGDGYYARTNELPDAFDIIKVSQDGIELINDTDSMLKGDERFVFKNKFADGKLFAVSFEGEDVYLNVYSVNVQENKPFELIEKMPVKADPVYLETDTLCGFELFGYDGHYYYAHRMNNKVMPLNMP